MSWGPALPPTKRTEVCSFLTPDLRQVTSRLRDRDIRVLNCFGSTPLPEDSDGDDGNNDETEKTTTMTMTTKTSSNNECSSERSEQCSSADKVRADRTCMVHVGSAELGRKVGPIPPYLRTTRFLSGKSAAAATTLNVGNAQLVGCSVGRSVSLAPGGPLTFGS